MIERRREGTDNYRETQTEKMRKTESVTETEGERERNRET